MEYLDPRVIPQNYDCDGYYPQSPLIDSDEELQYGRDLPSDYESETEE